MSWHRSAGRCELWFNRDELNTRAPELPPRDAEFAGVRYLAPRDSERGGTWILVNEFGLTVCLLNDYGSPHRPAAGDLSRGAIVLACAPCHHPVAAMETVEAMPLARLAPFRLLAMMPDCWPLLLHWDRCRLVRTTGADLPPPLSSSSYQPREVIAGRIGRFPALVRRGDADEFEAFHRQHDPERGAHSVLMRRPDAATRSITRISVSAESCTLAYEPVDWSAAGPAPGTRLELPRRRR